MSDQERIKALTAALRECTEAIYSETKHLDEMGGNVCDGLANAYSRACRVLSDGDAS